MGKGSRLRKQRKQQGSSLPKADAYIPVDLKDVRYGFSYWITGVVWGHDTIIVEPFCAVFGLGGWEITNLDKTEIDYHYAKTVLGDQGSMLIYEDRWTAINVCDAMKNEKTLLDSFMTYMSNEELSEYVGNKIGGNYG